MKELHCATTRPAYNFFQVLGTDLKGYLAVKTFVRLSASDAVTDPRKALFDILWECLTSFPTGDSLLVTRGLLHNNSINGDLWGHETNVAQLLLLETLKTVTDIKSELRPFYTTGVAGIILALVSRFSEPATYAYQAPSKEVEGYLADALLALCFVAADHHLGEYNEEKKLSGELTNHVKPFANGKMRPVDQHTEKFYPQSQARQDGVRHIVRSAADRMAQGEKPNQAGEKFLNELAYALFGHIDLATKLLILNSIPPLPK